MSATPAEPLELSITRNTTNKKCCPYTVAPEQKARVTYDNILRLSDDPDVSDAIKFLRAREIVHFQRFGETNRTKLKRAAVPAALIVSLNHADAVPKKPAVRNCRLPPAVAAPVQRIPPVPFPALHL